MELWVYAAGEITYRAPIRGQKQMLLSAAVVTFLAVYTHTRTHCRRVHVCLLQTFSTLMAPKQTQARLYICGNGKGC